MAEIDEIDEREEESIELDDVMLQKIKEYKEMLKKKKPDLDMDLLFRIFRVMNDSSEVHVAIDPIAEDGQWSSKAPTFAVSGITELEDGRIALRVNSEHHGLTVGSLAVKLRRAFKHKSISGVPVLYVKGEAVTQLTDAYSHALVREKWAGLPFDLVLAVKTEQPAEGQASAKAEE